MDCYRTLTQFRKDINLSTDDYKKGYCLYVLDIDPFYTFNTKRRGHCRLELKFAVALPESVTLIMYASFPEILNIDEARAVYVKWTILELKRLLKKYLCISRYVSV